MASKGVQRVAASIPVPKDRIRAQWARIRSKTESVEWQTEVSKYPVRFSDFEDGNLIAIQYNKKTHLVEDILDAAITAFPDSDVLEYNTPGFVYVGFPSVELRQAALTKPRLECSPSPLPLFPVVFSAGTRIHIKADRLPFFDSNKRLALLEDIFHPFGKILHTNSHFYGGRKLSSMEFILEVPMGSSEDMLLPRVVSARGHNILFSWSGVPFCFKCGEGTHTKIQCGKPADFRIEQAPTIKEPIMARAFADPKAPLRDLSKRAQPPKTQPKSQVDSTRVTEKSKSEWELVKKTKKRSRNTLSAGSAPSASDSDTPQPRRKIAPRPPVEESPSVSMPTSNPSDVSDPTPAQSENNGTDSIAPPEPTATTIDLSEKENTKEVAEPASEVTPRPESSGDAPEVKEREQIEPPPLPEKEADETTPKETVADLS
ncbi:hypothetical protein BGW38_008471 [Lunasporangiospora selenospora]|uniref:Uncharacterized protein n=1 Tax=Lunasporangiospora selenospora TaxID=979761 RepID=A0A9P6K943_9FUNG|nr:hypothetical protein BGW38_008471 [Lunasporangiospora selenospora]